MATGPPDPEQPVQTRASRWYPWLAFALAALALVGGLWAWTVRSGTGTSAETVHPVIITDIDDPPSHGDVVTVASGPFTTTARSWTVYWSYYCVMPGVHRWQVKVRLVPLDTARATARVLYKAHSPGGPSSYTEIFQEHGAGSYRFVVNVTRRCLWSLRAPPVAGRGT